MKPLEVLLLNKAKNSGKEGETTPRKCLINHTGAASFPSFFVVSAIDSNLKPKQLTAANLEFFAPKVGDNYELVIFSCDTNYAPRLNNNGSIRGVSVVEEGANWVVLKVDNADPYAWCSINVTNVISDA